MASAITRGVSSRLCWQSSQFCPAALSSVVLCTIYLQRPETQCGAIHNPLPHKHATSFQQLKMSVCIQKLKMVGNPQLLVLCVARTSDAGVKTHPETLVLFSVLVCRVHLAPHDPGLSNFATCQTQWSQSCAKEITLKGKVHIVCLLRLNLCCKLQ